MQQFKCTVEDRQELINGYRAVYTDHKGYTLFVNSIYEGKYVDHIHVIGDKRCLNSFIFLKSFDPPIKVIHVIRNLYDNIATALWYTAIHQGKTFEVIKQSNRTLKMDLEVVNIFIQHNCDLHAKTTFNLELIEIHGKDLILYPIRTILKISINVELTCYNYLEICSNKIYIKRVENPPHG